MTDTERRSTGNRRQIVRRNHEDSHDPERRLQQERRTRADRRSE